MVAVHQDTVQAEALRHKRCHATYYVSSVRAFLFHLRGVVFDMPSFEAAWYVVASYFEAGIHE